MVQKCTASSSIATFGSCPDSPVLTAYRSTLLTRSGLPFLNRLKTTILKLEYHFWEAEQIPI